MRQAHNSAVMVGGATEDDGHAAATVLASTALASLLRSVHSIEGLSTLVTKPLLPAASGASFAPPPEHSKLKKGYLQAVRCLHPDKTGGEGVATRLAAEAAFTVLNGAWECVNDGPTGAYMNTSTGTGAAGGAGEGEGAEA